MHIVADYFPLLLFFIAYKLADIYVATGVAIVASIAQIVYFKVRGRISAVHWLSLAIIVVFGGATLLLRDETFIKWKPTVLYSLFAVVLATGKVVFGRDLLALIAKGLTLPAHVWSSMTWLWTGYFVAMAFANWYVAFNFSTDTWVNFKLWGSLGLFLAFTVAQGVWLSRYVVEERT